MIVTNAIFQKSFILAKQSNETNIAYIFKTRRNSRLKSVFRLNYDKHRNYSSWASNTWQQVIVETRRYSKLIWIFSLLFSLFCFLHQIFRWNFVVLRNVLMLRICVVVEFICVGIIFIHSFRSCQFRNGNNGLKII